MASSSTPQIILKTVVGGFVVLSCYKFLTKLWRKKQIKQEIKIEEQILQPFFQYHTNNLTFTFTFIQKNEIRIHGQELGQRRIFKARFTYEILPDKIKSLFQNLDCFWKSLISNLGDYLQVKNNHLYFVIQIKQMKNSIQIPLHEVQLSDVNFIQKLRSDFDKVNSLCEQISHMETKLKNDYKNQVQLYKNEIETLKNEIQNLKRQKELKKQTMKTQMNETLKQKDRQSIGLKRQIQSLLSLKCTTVNCSNKIILWSVQNYAHQYSTMSYCCLCFQKHKK